METENITIIQANAWVMTTQAKSSTGAPKVNNHYDLNSLGDASQMNWTLKNEKDLNREKKGIPAYSHEGKRAQVT